MTTANTAQNDDSNADDSAKPDYSSVNDLSHEMSEEEEQAFVNEQLGIRGDKDASAKDDKDSNDKDTSTGEDESTDTNDKDSSASDRKKTDDTATGKDEEDKADFHTKDDDGSTESKDKTSDKSTVELDENGVQTDDLWVEAENAEGKTVKLVFDPSNPASFLPDDFTFKSDKQLFEILDAKAEMANLYKDRSTKFDADQETKAAESQAKEQEQSTLTGWDNEIKDLIDAGMLEAPKVKPNDKNWLEDPSVQKIETVFKYMKSENDKRSAEGKAKIQSFGTAFSLYSHDEQVKADADKAKREAETIKKRGALVGGSSAASAGGEKPMYTRGKYSSVWDVPVNDA